MNLTKTSAAVAVIGLLAASTTAMAQGPYVGGELLRSHFDSDNFSVDDIDDDDISWKLLAGYRLTPHFALEGAYTKFGKSQAPAVAVGGPFEARADAFSAFGVGLWPVGPVDLFLKAGVARIDAKGNVGAVLFKDKATEFAYGAGAQFNFGRLGLRAEYEKFDTDVVGDLDTISVGLIFSFGDY